MLSSLMKSRGSIPGRRDSKDKPARKVLTKKELGEFGQQQGGQRGWREPRRRAEVVEVSQTMPAV